MAVTGRTLVVVALPVATGLRALGRYGVRCGRSGSCARHGACTGCSSWARLKGWQSSWPSPSARSHAGLQVVGYCVPDKRHVDLPRRSRRARVPLLGRRTTSGRATLVSGATTIAITSSGAITASQLRRLAWDLEGSGIDILVAPALTDIAGPRIHLRPVAGLPLIHLEEPEFDGGRQTVKAVDRPASPRWSLLVLLSPLLLVLAVLVAVTSPGPVLFRQTRVGRNGQPFTMLKFRSMRHDAERHAGIAAVANENADGLLFKIKADPRVTPWAGCCGGSASTSCPSWSTCSRGQMSLVGSAPAAASRRSRCTARTSPDGCWSSQGSPGCGRSPAARTCSWDESVRLDLHYVENWSIALDWHDPLEDGLRGLRPPRAY